MGKKKKTGSDRIISSLTIFLCRFPAHVLMALIAGALVGCTDGLTFPPRVVAHALARQLWGLHPCLFPWPAMNLALLPLSHSSTVCQSPIPGRFSLFSMLCCGNQRVCSRFCGDLQTAVMGTERKFVLGKTIERIQTWITFSCDLTPEGITGAALYSEQHPIILVLTRSMLGKDGESTCKHIVKVNTRRAQGMK